MLVTGPFPTRGKFHNEVPFFCHIKMPDMRLLLVSSHGRTNHPPPGLSLVPLMWFLRCFLSSVSDTLVKVTLCTPFSLRGCKDSVMTPPVAWPTTLSLSWYNQKVKQLQDIIRKFMISCLLLFYEFVLFVFFLLYFLP